MEPPDEIDDLLSSDGDDALGAILRRLQYLAEPVSSRTETRHLLAAAAAHRQPQPAPASRTWSLARVAAAAAVMIMGLGGAAWAGALPAPIQTAVSNLSRTVVDHLPWTPGSAALEPVADPSPDADLGADVERRVSALSSSSRTWAACAAGSAREWIDSAEAPDAPAFDPSVDCGPPPRPDDFGLASPETAVTVPEEAQAYAGALRTWVDCTRGYAHEWVAGGKATPFDPLPSCGQPPAPEDYGLPASRFGPERWLERVQRLAERISSGQEATPESTADHQDQVSERGDGDVDTIALEEAVDRWMTCVRELGGVSAETIYQTCGAPPDPGYFRR
jgi:hypothetical protein